jgi:hypothetical protein
VGQLTSTNLLPDPFPASHPFCNPSRHRSSLLQVDHDALKQYFPLGIVLPQMFAIYETLLSLKFVRQEVRPAVPLPLAAPPLRYHCRYCCCCC